jgi:hypothetical protein
VNIFNGLKRSRSIDHVVEITKLIEFDGLDGAHSVVGTEAISRHFHTVTLPTGVVNTTHYSIGSLILNVEIQILYLDFVIVNLRALSPHKHNCKLAIEQIANKRNLNIV